MKPTNLLNEFVKIQNLQFELDKAKQEQARIRRTVRSLSQKIPQKIRELPLR